MKSSAENYGAIVVAPNEADPFIAGLAIASNTKTHLPYIVYSDDSDMFYYGVKYVMNVSGEVYSLDDTLERLGVTLPEFQEICSKAGNDYNDSHRQFSLSLLSKDLPMSLPKL